jgi:hypothetical protein
MRLLKIQHRLTPPRLRRKLPFLFSYTHNVFSRENVLHGKQFMATHRIHISVCHTGFVSRAQTPYCWNQISRAAHVLKLIYVAQFGKAQKGSRVPLASAERLQSCARTAKKKRNLFEPRRFEEKTLFLFMVEQRRRISRLCAV